MFHRMSLLVPFSILRFGGERCLEPWNRAGQPYLRAKSMEEGFSRRLNFPGVSQESQIFEHHITAVARARDHFAPHL